MSHTKLIRTIFQAFLLILAQLTTAAPPAILSVVPPPGALGELREITVTFTKPVAGIEFSDLLLNGVPALELRGAGAAWTFTVQRPPDGLVRVAWDPGQFISDLETRPNRFDATAPGAAWEYTLVDAAPPEVAALTPAPGAIVRQLTQVEVLFNELVTGVEAGDLLINGSPAAGLQVLGGGRYRFTFPPPPGGTVQAAWAAGHGITDFAAQAFAGGAWSYVLNPEYGLPRIRINEFIAANLSGLKDENNEFEDWIEIHNYGGTAVNLAGWALTDDRDDPGRWTFPATNLAAGQYLVVFASSKDRRVPGARLHTNFKLNGYGEYLALYNAESPREAVSELAPRFPEQRNDYSYGLDSAHNWKYFKTPTPGAANGTSTIPGLAPPPHFNVARGLFDAPFQLILNTSLPGTSIRYTTDGSEPSETNGLVYAGALTISNTTVFRAAAFGANLLPSATVTHSYVFLDQVLRQPNNPPGFPAGSTVFSGYPSDYEMDPEIVTNPDDGPMLKTALKALPTVSIVMKTDDLFGASNGIYTHPEPAANQRHLWERPCSVEMVLTNGQTGFQIDCGIRIQGNASRSPLKTPKHPFRLMFKGDYGPGRLDYPVYPDSPVASFNTLVLRADFNNSWLHWGGDQRQRGSKIRDAWVKDTFREMGQASGHARHCHLYLNGLYWGVYDFGERIDAEFGASYFGGTADEYDAIASKPTEAIDGTIAAYNTMVSAATARDLRYLTNYVHLQRYLDLTNFIDYMLLNFYGANQDWGLDGNWNAVCRRAGGTFKYFPWDGEQLIVQPGDNRVASTDLPSNLHPNLIKSLEYKLAFADRVHQHLFNEGALTTNAAARRWLRRVAQLDAAIAAESARWGDYRRDVAQYSSGPYVLYTRKDYWVPENNRMLNTYFPQRHGIFMQQLRSAGLYPGVAAPVFSQHGGRAPRGFALAITATNAIYYTTNGADPRVFGTGAVAPDARLYDASLSLGGSMEVKARALFGTNWSALNEAAFTVDSLDVPLRFTEIMYHPLGGDVYEYIELRNIGGTALDLGNYSLLNVTYTFPPQTILAPGQIIVLGSSVSPGNWSARYPGVEVFGRFDGNLANGGMRLAVLNAARAVVCAVEYDDEGSWPKVADGLGYSLEIIDPWGDPNDPANWRASAALDGTPGDVAPPPALSGVVLNEIMAENVSAVPNGATHPDWIELRNLSAQPVELANWSLTDGENPRKFVFPEGTVIGARGYLVVWCDGVTNTTPGPHTGFALSRNGETIFLYNAQTSRVDGVSFGPQLPDFSVGRIAGNWELTVPTPNAANAAAALAASTNLVLNEWLANAAPGAEDWIELYNRAAGAPVSLRGIYLGTSNSIYQVNSLSFVLAGGFAQLIADAKPGADHLGFKLAAAGGTIVLYSEAGAEIDRVAYGPQVEAVSQGRLPDGGAAIRGFPGSASPRAANYVLTYAGPVLNEVLAINRGAVTNALGRTPDWVELHNPNAAAFDLSGLRLGTSMNDPAPWVFPAGASVPANGYLVVWFDDNAPASTDLSSVLNTGRALEGQGGAVVLFNRAGQPVDVLEYGPQVRDVSLGRAGGAWRLLAQPTPGAANAGPAALGSPAHLRLNEWMADPLDGNDWFELYNPDGQPVSLAGLYVADHPSLFGLADFALPPLSFIGPEDFVRLIADGQPADGANHVSFSLDAQGEALRLYSPDLGVIDAVYFGTQTLGVSEGRLPDGADHRVFFPRSASPAASNFLPLENAVIHEVLARADPPLEDAIELYNPASRAADLGGWYLSGTSANFKQFRIPDGATLPGGGYLVFYAAQFNSGAPGGFNLQAASGGQVFLSAADGAGNLTGYRAAAAFGPADRGISFGRFVTSAGVEFPPLSWPTFGVEAPATPAEFRAGAGAFNAYPAVGPVVINEIMYHPPDAGTNDNVLDEYIELFNFGGEPAPLFDPAHPANTWRLDNGVRFQFPPNLVLPAGGRLLVVNFDPVANAAQTAAFRAKYRVPETVGLAGSYAGKLDNGGETLELLSPGAPTAGAAEVPYWPRDRVAYADAAPWPVSGDGDGNSLQRRAAADYGNEPLNWFAAAPTAGQPNAEVPALPPVIFEPPLDRAVSTNSTVLFSVAAGGARPLSYQWYFDSAPIAQATNPVLRLDDPRPEQAGGYAVVVANAAGAVTSAPARLSLIVPLAILDLTPGQTVFSGTPLTLSVVVNSPASAEYQWRRNGVEIPGATNASLEFAALQVSDAGVYSVLVSNPSGSVASAGIALTVLRGIEILSQPQNRTNQPGTVAVFSVTAAGTGALRYQWQFKGVFMEAATNLLHATNDTLTLDNVQLEQGGEYAVQVMDDLSALRSQPARLLVLVRPKIIQQPQGLTVAAGSNVTVAISVEGTLPMGFRWRKQVGMGSVYLATNSLYSFTAAYPIPNIQTNDATGYNVLITNAASLSAVTSSNAYITVVVPPADQVVEPGATVVFNTLVFGRPRITYQWLRNNDPLAGQTNAALTLTNAQPADSATYAVVVSAITNTPIAPATFSARLIVGAADRDGDGLPDDWELAHQLNPGDAGDATLDADRDGLNNRDEYLAGTDPNDPQSVLKITGLAVAPGASPLVRFSFGAMSNRTYSVLLRQSLPAGAWQRLADISPAAPTNRVIQFTNAVPAGAPPRFYRVVTPRVPE